MTPFSKRPSKFTARFLAALVIFALLNALLAFHAHSQSSHLDEAAIQSSDYETRQQGPWTWWIARAFLEREKTPEIIIFGSSQMGSATFSADANNLQKDLDCVVYRRASTLEQELLKRTGKHFDTFNFAMGGSMVSDQLMLDRALLTGKHKPRLAIIGVNPRDFIDNDLPALNATETFKYLAPYVSLGDVLDAADPDFFSYLDWQLDQCIPMKLMRLERQRQAQTIIARALPQAKPSTADAGSFSQSTKKTLFLRAISGSIGEVKPGEWIVPRFVPDAYMDNTKEYLHRYHNFDPPIYSSEKTFFRALLADMRQKNIPVVIVGMPSQIENRLLLPTAFWSQFRHFIDSSCRDYGAVFCDLSESKQFVRHDYLDTVHLNAYGGKKFFASLADFVASTPKLASSVRSGGNAQDQLGLNAGVDTWH